MEKVKGAADAFSDFLFDFSELSTPVFVVLATDFGFRSEIGQGKRRKIRHPILDT